MYCIKEISNRQKILLKEICQQENPTVAVWQELFSREGINVSREMLENALEKALRMEERMNQSKIFMLTEENSLYPPEVKRLKNPPIVLFGRGNPLLLNSSILGIIGTRKPSKEGEKIAWKLGQNLSQSKTILSGLAVGIDEMAHKGALKGSKNTIAVLPSSVEGVYPPQNQKLADQIAAEDGLLLSPFGGDSPIQKYYFVYRDELQAALAEALYVIETGIRGGTLHTVQYGKKYNKKIFIYPWKEVRIENLGNFKLLEDSYMKVFPLESLDKEQ